MDRVAIIGCGGSGKTFLARQLARELRAPLTHLDGLYYDRAWNPSSMEAFAAAQRELVARPRWVIEGNYVSTLPIRLAAADTVILLDLPARTCVRGVLGRQVRYGGGQHRSAGVYNRMTWPFLRYIWGFRSTMLPRVHQLISEHAPRAQIIVVRKRSTTTAIREIGQAGLKRPGASEHESRSSR